MESPASQKKRSLMPSGKLRRSLRAHGHALAAVVQIGKGGVTSSVIKQINQALADHELIKVKIGGESPADRFEAAERLAGEPGVSVVQIIGRILLLYKRHPQRPRFEGKRAAAARDDADALPGKPERASRKKANRSGKVAKPRRPAGKAAGHRRER
jgi:RNA-binding protein